MRWNVFFLCSLQICMDITRYTTSFMFYYFGFWCLDWINAVVRFFDKCLFRHLFKLKLFCIRYKLEIFIAFKDKLVFSLDLIFECQWDFRNKPDGRKWVGLLWKHLYYDNSTDINTYCPTGLMSYLFYAKKLWLIGILFFNVNQKMIAGIIGGKV